jgi:hypothetical protein
MFPEVLAMTKPSVDLCDLPVREPPPPTVVEQMGPIIFEMPNQKWCAQLLAADFPTASREDVLAAINECEPELVRSGFSDLAELREEIKRVHPAWKI